MIAAKRKFHTKFNFLQMKTIFRNYKLATSGKIITVSLQALFRAVGIDGEVTNGAIPVAVLDCLRVLIERPNVTGLVSIKRGAQASGTYYTVTDDELTIHVAGLHGGISRVYVCAQYGTNNPAALVCELNAPQNVAFLEVDGSFTPLERAAAKDVETEDGDHYYAYVYKHGNVVIWFATEKLDKHGNTVTAFVADGLDAEFEDATEEQGRIVYNVSNVPVYDEEEDVVLSPNNIFGGAGGNENLLIGTQEEREALTDVSNGVQFNELHEDEETGDVTVKRFIYLNEAWVELQSNLLIGTQEEREALTNVAQGIEFNEVHYNEETGVYSIRRYVYENDDWVELESPQTETEETVSLNVSTFDGLGNVEGLAVGITDTTTGNVIQRNLDHDGNCTFKIVKEHHYTISVASLQGYRDIPDLSLIATLDERTVNLVFQSASVGAETVVLHVTVYDQNYQDITSTDTDFIGQEVEVQIDGEDEPRVVTIGEDHSAQIDIEYGKEYTINAPFKSGYTSRYATTFTHTASVPQREIPLHYIQVVATGIYGVTSDGTFHSYEDIEAMTEEERAAIIAIAVNTSRLGAANAGFMFKIPKSTESKQWAASNVEFDKTILPFKTSQATAVLDLDGAGNTEKIIDIGDSMGVNTPAADWCVQQTLVIGGETKTGFLGAYGQMYALAENITPINAIFSLCGKAAPGFTSGDWWTATQYSASVAVSLDNGAFNGNYKNNSLTTVALFAL